MSADAAGSFVSTGSLPQPEEVAAWVTAAHDEFRAVNDGANSDVYPALARADARHFGICLAGVGGRFFTAGDVDVPFTIMSVSKPFVFALVCELLGTAETRRRLGANSTGLPFNSLEAIERGAGVTNPMVNPGAIAATSFVPGATADDRWELVQRRLSEFAGRELALDDEVLASALESNVRNQSIARLVDSFDGLGCDPADAVDLYTRQCSLSVTARDLAVMGATLAHGGVNPVTGRRVASSDVCHATLAVMVTAGMYETSGDWLYEVGLPAKSGIGGGIVTVSPGKGGMGTFSPPLAPTSARLAIATSAATGRRSNVAWSPARSRSTPRSSPRSPSSRWRPACRCGSARTGPSPTKRSPRPTA